MPNKSVLENIVLADLTRLLPGALITQSLGDWGASIIKVEEPDQGDPARQFPPDGLGDHFTKTGHLSE
jgi:CoA:oxalate CoA-transferase